MPVRRELLSSHRFLFGGFVFSGFFSEVFGFGFRGARFSLLRGGYFARSCVLFFCICNKSFTIVK